MGNYRSFTLKYNFYILKTNERLPFNYGYDMFGSGIQGGKWVKENVLTLFKENYFEIDFSKRGFYEHIPDARRSNKKALKPINIS